MNIRYIKYNDRIIKIKILKNQDGYLTVQTEDNEILGIPPEADTHIYKTYEDCEYYEDCCCDWFIPM